jgi:hypothetical protein
MTEMYSNTNEVFFMHIFSQHTFDILGMQPKGACARVVPWYTHNLHHCEHRIMHTSDTSPDGTRNIDMVAWNPSSHRYHMFVP